MTTQEILEVIWQALNDIDLTRLEAIFRSVDGFTLKVDGKRYAVRIEIEELE